MKKMNQADLNRWIGSQIQKERLSNKLSQEDLSERIGISRSFISILENGNKAGKMETYYRIASALGISLCELFRGEENSEIADEILALLSDCSIKEAHALMEILRVSKKQLSLFQECNGANT